MWLLIIIVKLTEEVCWLSCFHSYPTVQLFIVNFEFCVQILAEVKYMEGNIVELETAIEEKSGPLKLAHTRLEIRSERPNKELVRDPVQYGLTEEVREITESIQHLQNMVAESRQALKDLIRNQLTLEEDIAIKAKSLYVDRELCMGLRAQLGARD